MGNLIRTILLQPIFNALLLIYALLPGNDFGVALIVFTILIRILLWPLMKRQLHQQKKMKEIQPEIARVKEKAKGDKTKESQMLVELFKEKEVNPFSSFGVVLLQLPILLTIFYVIRRILDPGQVSELAYASVAKLSAVQDIVNLGVAENFHPSLFGLVDLSQPNIILALLAGLVQYFQARQLMPMNTTQTSDSKNIGFNMSLIFPIITVVVAMRLPSALALYWFASTSIAVVQQYIIMQEEVDYMRLLPGRRKKQPTEAEVIEEKPKKSRAKKSKSKKARK